MTNGKSLRKKQGMRKPWNGCVSCQPLCVWVCPCPVCMQAFSLHKGTEGVYTQMGKQSHCLLFCILLCWERSVGIDFSQSARRRTEVSGTRSHRMLHLYANSLSRLPCRVFLLHTTAESVMPLSVPITVFAPEVSRSRFQVSLIPLNPHRFGFRSIMASAQVGSPLLGS